MAGKRKEYKHGDFIIVRNRGWFLPCLISVEGTEMPELICLGPEGYLKDAESAIQRARSHPGSARTTPPQETPEGE